MSETPEFIRDLEHVLQLRIEAAREFSASPGARALAELHADTFDHETTNAIVDAHITSEVQRRLDEEAAVERRRRVGR